MSGKRKFIEIDSEDYSIQLQNNADSHPSNTSKLSDFDSNPFRALLKKTKINDDIPESKTIFIDDTPDIIENPSNDLIFQIMKSFDDLEKTQAKISNTKEIKIISWNVNGLRKITTSGKLREFFKSSNPDILCLNEIKLTEEKVYDYGLTKWFPPEYFFYLNCNKGKGCYGVGIISKLKPKSVRYGMGIKKHDNEARLITLEFDQFYVVCCYSPYSGNKQERFNYRINEWDPDLRNYLIGLKTVKSTILCGDLNVAYEDLDVHNPKLPIGLASVTKEERNNFTKLLSEGFVDMFRYKYPKIQKYTFLSYFGGKRQTKGWRLDYFLVDKESKGNVVDCLIHEDVEGSDHCPIELIYKLK